MNNKYNYCLDMIKGIACFCIVFMHCEFPGRLGIVIQCVSRFSVPFFFMISGYFSYRIKDNINGKEHFRLDKHLKKIKHIGLIVIAASGLYLLVALVRHLVGHVTYTVTLRSIFIWVVFNQPTIITLEIWFLFALLYVYLVYAVIDRFNLQNVAYIAMIILFALYIFMAQGMYLLGHDVPNYIYRNWLLEGLPYFMLGHWLHRRESFGKVGNWSNGLLISVFVIATFLCVAERWFMGRDFGVNIMTIPQVIALFCLAINNAGRGKGILQMIGTRYSMYIYILHPMMITILAAVYVAANISNNLIARYFMPIIVCVISLLCSMGLYKVRIWRRRT